MSIEEEFYSITVQLVELTIKNKSTLERSHEEDSRGNGYMAAVYLGDYNDALANIERVKEIGKTLGDQLTPEIRNNICIKVQERCSFY